MLERAIRVNAAHGLQLSREDKQALCRRLYDADPTPAKAKALEKMLSVSSSSVAKWTERIREANKQKQQETARKMWMLCHTHEEIAAAVGVEKRTVTDWIKSLGEISKIGKTAQIQAAHDEEDFQPPLYDVWSWAKKSEGVSHYGNSDARIVDNMLWLYTQPFDVVFDPFAGGGSTVDICRKRSRRVYASDLTVKPGREHEIREHDIVGAIPRLPWKEVSLVYLDPPYRAQAAGKYSEKLTDLANMVLEEFHDVLAGIIKTIAAKLRSGAHIALLISPTQWKADDRHFPEDHADEMRFRMRKVEALRYQRTYQIPYSSEQYNGTQVEWAKDHRVSMVLSRSLTVWQVH